MRILHVIPSLAASEGGPSRAIWRMLGAVEQVHPSARAVVLATDHGLSSDDRAKLAVSESRSSTQFVPLSVRPYKFSIRGASMLMRTIGDYDVVHCHALFSFLPVFAAFVARRARIPYVIRPLGTLNEYGLRARRPWAKRLSIGLIERRLLRDASAVHCTSEAEVIDVLNLCPTAKTVVIPLAVDTADAAPRPEVIDALLGSHRGQRIVLFLSRLDPKKNVEVLIDSFAMLAQAMPDVTLLIAGAGEAMYVSSLHARASSAGLHERIVWAGHIDGEKKAAAFACASLFVLPSHSENFGIAAAEALAAGLPCILSPGVALSAQVAQYGAGIVVEPEARALSDAMQNLLTDRAAHARSSEAAKHLAASEFSEAAMGERLMALYERLRRR
jgi:glycosyltransferase involved in cell wall biosynthesis